MVAGNKELLLPIGRCENRRLRIVSAVCKELQSQKRMSGAAFSQINLDGIGLPSSIRTQCHEIQGEAPYDSFFRKTPPNLGSFPGNERSIAGVGRKYAAEVTLPGWAT